MARTVAEIYNRIIQEKQSQSSLNGLLPSGDNYDNFLSELSTNSKVGIWRLWVYLISVAHFILETYWDLFKKEVIDLSNAGRWGTESWWINKAYAYQHGDAVQPVLVNSLWVSGYPTIDTSKQIIKYAAMYGNTLKVAKSDGNGGLIGLSPSELYAFVEGYIKRTIIPSAYISVISQNGDLMKLSLDVYFDPLLDRDQGKTDIVTAVNNYLTNLIRENNTNGVLDRNDLIRAVRSVTGVRNAYITLLECKPSSSDLYTPIERAYPSFAGYIIIDPDHLLEDNINMIAE